MNILLINDTRIEKNPGCHATVNALMEFIHENLSNVEFQTLKLGQDYDVFKKPNLFRRNFLQKVIFKLFKIDKKGFNFNLWKSLALNEFSENTKKAIIDSNLVIVNMEGTIHSNNLGAMTLMGMAYFSKSIGKKVAMLNGSFQSMNVYLSKEVLNKVDFLAVREPISYKYLQTLKINSFLIPDFAFKSSIFNTAKIYVTSTTCKKCLYTSGVLSVYPNQKNGISLNKVKFHIEEIKKLGYEPYFLMVEPKEEFIVRELVSMGVHVICAYEDGVSFKNIGTVIKSFDLLVTARYHIGIFGIMSNVKTLFLPSNTKKVQGVLQLIKGEELFLDADFKNFENKVKRLNFSKIKFNLNFENYYASFKSFLNGVEIE